VKPYYKSRNGHLFSVLKGACYPIVDCDDKFMTQMNRLRKSRLFSTIFQANTELDMESVSDRGRESITGLDCKRLSVANKIQNYLLETIDVLKLNVNDYFEPEATILRSLALCNEQGSHYHYKL